MRRPPDPDAAAAAHQKDLRGFSKRALLVLGASLLLQPVGGSLAEAKRRKPHGRPQCWGTAGGGIRSPMCKREEADRRKAAGKKAAGAYTK